ncbi:MAG: histidine phosphatase family protein [Thermoplasmata archaeon]
MPGKVILIRHAHPLVSHDRPSEWELSPQGREAASALAGLAFWREVGVLYCSPERKAVQTAEPISARWRTPIYILEDLREVVRPREAKDYEAKLGAFLAGSPPPGWEGAEGAASRILETIDILSSQMEGDVGVVSHGIILTLFLAKMQDAKPSVELHRSIGFGDHAIFDPRSRKIIREFTGEAMIG